MKTPKDPVVSASPAQCGEIFNRHVSMVCNLPKGHSHMHHFVDAAAQPVAADLPQSSESEVMPNAGLEEVASAASLKTSGLANPPKVEDALPRNKWTPCPICESEYDGKFCHACRNEPVERVMQLIDATASTGAYFTSAEFKEQLAAILSPFFAQVSQPPTGKCGICASTDFHSVVCAGCGGINGKSVWFQSLAPVTPVSPTPANEIIHACTCKEPSQEFPCRVCNRRDEVTK